MGEYLCYSEFDKLFADDKVRVQTDKYLLLLDGIILNKSELYNSKRDQSWSDFLYALYINKGEQFFTVLRGSFIGALYDIELDKWMVFRNHLGGRPIYYSTEGFYVSSDISWLYNAMRGDNISLHLDPIGVRMVLESGFGMTIDNYTICKEVKKLHPCCYLVYENGKLTEKQSYIIKREEIKLSSEDEYLEMIDEVYKNAIRRQFGKDDEYGYKTVTCLSGGVDSRMMVWMSHQLGWNKQLNITSSNSGWYDETVARQIAKDLRHEWLFKPMDDANFMYQVDESTRITGGNRAFYGVMHMESLLSLINYENANLGILHTGSQGEILKGEAVFGGNINKSTNYYQNYLDDLGIKSIIDYSDPETCTIMNKYFQVDQGNGMSPLLDLDFFETTLKIPSSLRKDEYIYKQWILKKHPDANKYIWATTGLPYGSKRFNPRIPLIHVYLHHLPKYIKYKMGYGTFMMNPFNMFYKSDDGLRTYYDSYGQYLDVINDVDIRKMVEKDFYSEQIIQRMKAISILSAIKLFSLR